MKAITQIERRRVLIIDDDKILLSMISDFLTSKGFDVHVAESGEAGLAMTTKCSPDIILLDINMPGIGGFGFLRRIMSGNDALKYPVLVFTARTTTEDYFQGIPVDDFIAKPCDKSVLLNKIQGILEKRKKVPIKTILIGENDRLVGKKLTRVFREAGFKIEKASTGPEVLEKAEVCLPDAILVKQILTGMNGDSVAAILHDMPRTHSIPVVLYFKSQMAKEPQEEDHLRHSKGITRYLATDNAVTLLTAMQEVVFGQSVKNSGGG